MNDKNKKIVTILSIFTIIFTLMGGTLAYWTWTSTEITGVAFTISKDFSCSADGGGNITAANISLEPTTCSNSSSAIKRKIVVTPDIKTNGIEISMDLWLNINNIDMPLSDSYNLRYVLTTSEDSCSDSGVISSGNFNGKKNGDKVVLMEKNYTADANETYYLYIWLDKAETDIATANQSFDFSLGGVCSNYIGEPEAPVLDDGMIPVTIADDGTVTMVSENDPNWYNYEEKQWANIVLVEEDGAGETDSHPRSYYQNTDNIGEEVTQEDILAYYVWIPRYKYKMPQTKCSDIPEEERNMSDYPECYAPYTLTDDEKNDLIIYKSHCNLNTGLYEENKVNNGSKKDIELGLSTGRLLDGTSIISYIENYNIELTENGYYECTGDEMTGSEITLTSSEFNRNITFTTKEATIDISFQSSSESMLFGNATTEYRSHPAFWWNNDNDTVVDIGETLPGIWVGKFETTPDKNSTCYTTADSTNCNNSTQNATILPNTVSLRYQDVSNQFATSRNFSKSENVYGLNNSNTNAHMMKNIEWGAVAYLSHSVYGINKEIYINNNRKYYTGRSGGDPNKTPSAYGAYTWLGELIDSSGNISTFAEDRTLGTNASTTGNVTGIYDMSGGSFESVMGHYGNTIDTENDESGFSSMPESKYYDLYSEEDFLGTKYESLAYCTIDSCGGHALYETAGWYNDSYTFVEGGESLWAVRSGSYMVSRTGGLFLSSAFSGTGGSAYSWRSVLVPGFGD